MGARDRILLDAIARGDVRGVRALLSDGVPVNIGRWCRIVHGRRSPPLVAAVSSGSLELVQMLLDAGADVNVETRYWSTPLSVACYDDNLAIIDVLLSAGANINQARQQNASPLEQAAFYGRTELVERLLRAGADPERLLGGGISTLFRIRPSILKKMAAAAAHVTPEVADFIASLPDEEMVDRPERQRPGQQ
jgi:hypothetical protein